MLIWRIESRDDRNGPYTTKTRVSVRTDQMLDSVTYGPNSVTTHPPPRSDGIGNIRFTERCGFATLREMVQWFSDPLIRSLVEDNFEIVNYEVSARYVRRGRRQLVFVEHESSSRRVRGLDVLSRVR